MNDVPIWHLLKNQSFLQDHEHSSTIDSLVLWPNPISLLPESHPAASETNFGVEHDLETVSLYETAHLMCLLPFQVQNCAPSFP